MERISDLEKKYVMDALNNAFATSLNSVYNNKLEKAFAEKFNAKYAIGHCNGTATLHVALCALGIGPGDEVIVPALTMSSTSIPVVLCGAVPVFADSDIDTFEISADGIEKVITPKTKAIITVSLYGLAPDYDKIIALCKKHNIALIEDNAECFLGKYNGKYVGEFGDFASFSFQASKHLTTGEGGMLLCNDEGLADKARRFNCLGYAGVSASKGKITRNDIQDPAYSRHISFGYNYRMSELQAACALGQVERCEELVNQRLEVVKLFDEAVAGGEDIVKKQVTPSNCVNSYWTYCLVLQTSKPEKDWYRFRGLFQKNGGDGYYAAWKLSYNEPAYQDLQGKPGYWQKYDETCCPNAEYLQKRMIQLKTNYWDIEEAKQQAAILKKTIAEYRNTK